MIKEGIINVYKPQKYTSHDCVNIVRKALGTKKVGHCGTLDPMATGLLPICVGKATKFIEYFDLDFKTYICTAKLGYESDTLDIWGNVNEVSNDEILGNITKQSLCNIIEKYFIGEIEQIPPKYSALKVNGKRLYEYARSGEDVKISSRKIYIKKIELLEYNNDEGSFTFEVVCSKGTYIRTICNDIGKKIGISCIMSKLERIETGYFGKKESISIEEIKEIISRQNKQDNGEKKFIPNEKTIENVSKYVKNIDETLLNLGEIVIQKEKVKYYLNGGKISLKDMSVIKKPEYIEREPHIKGLDYFKNLYKVYMMDDNKKIFLGTAQKLEYYKAHKIFFHE